ncbi:hypothetical protein SERLA73DRAFT_50627 [Serpula lacrymans var. lacrymans S7.3]|uniref:Elongator complex protein 1 n=1 Tax=Serpula lacrymans var. lacrymans (strain S7.3) TaxID=936435 RepID=F8PSV8_SERL3|nr:hypothetical protein SERLA73DRAFT_50627 [Serpula lacrymans var. lacrymans S7.3]
MISTTRTTSSSYSALPQVVSFKALPEANCLSLVMRGGDIIVIPLDEDNSTPDVVGGVDSGILAASWSPDDSLLVLVTGEEKLILMTSTFDVLSESVLQSSEFGEDAPINVGWGSKQTQFHGSLGKKAAQANPSIAIGSSPDDDSAPHISWRGDGAYFVVSALSSGIHSDMAHRTLRVFDRQAVLQSTSEAVAGLEHPVSWRPSGNVIASTQRFGFPGGGAGKRERHDIVFFERNGLRHGEFGLRRTENRAQDSDRWDYKVKEIHWSPDSNVLAIWITEDQGDILQLWTMGNYHWYFKQEISAPKLSSSKPGRFTSVCWHPEKALTLILTTHSQVLQRSYNWETCASQIRPPKDTGSVAVVDGDKVLLTPFRSQNVPPPMSSYQLSLNGAPSSSTRNRVPVHLAFSNERDVLAALWESGYIELWNLHTRIGPSSGKIMEPVRIWSGSAQNGLDWTGRQIVIKDMKDSSRSDIAQVTILGSAAVGPDQLFVVEVHLGEGSTSIGNYKVATLGRNGRLVISSDILAWQDPGENTQSLLLFVGLSSTGKLYVSGKDTQTHVVSNNANSFTLASGFVIYTTTSHEAYFAPLSKLASQFHDPADAAGTTRDSVDDWEKRRVERGSRIVTAVSSNMSLVLQMPRGNLETINPRPLVTEVVKQDLDAGNYRKAFLACRKHRIDLSFIVEHDQEAFMRRLSSFVKQVDEVDYINLFLTSLGSHLPVEDISASCDAIRVELERVDLTKYINSILTAYVVKSPPDHEAGLALLLRLRDAEPNIVEDAVKYIIFLVDADQLFNAALGMYDFSLVLMVAQHAQKDPREYLPFLRDLKALTKYYQRFKIDDHLRRYSKALRDLSLAESAHFEEAMEYVERHQLYEEALAVWTESENRNRVLCIYGNWLFDRREFRQAALVFIEACEPLKAMVAHERALQWQELFELASREKVQEDELQGMAYRVAEELTSKKRHAEAARVLLDYSKDVRQAVIALVNGNEFSEARRIITVHSMPELVDDIVLPGALESKSQYTEDISEMREQLRKQVSRLQELRVKKVEEPDAFYGTEDANLHNVDTMTDVSMPLTAFTRYTVAPTTTSKASNSRSKRKMERKVGSGRKGTVDEEEYLLKSIAKLVTRCNMTQGDVSKLLPHLLHLSNEHRTEGKELQDDMGKFQVELRNAVEEVWTRPGENAEPNPDDTWAARMQKKEGERLTDPIERVVKPEMSLPDWGLRLLQLQIDKTS